MTLDPSYALSYSGLSYAHALTGFYGIEQGKEAFARAKAAADRALALDPSLGEPHIALSMVASFIARDFEGGVREAQRAVELAPDLALAHHWLALTYNLMGRQKEALPHIRKAVELDPLTALFQAHLGWVLHCAGRDEEAWPVLNTALESHPNNYYVMRIMVYVCHTSRRGTEAVEIGKRIAGLSDSTATRYGLLGFAYASAGRTEEAQQLIQQLQQDTTSNSDCAEWQS